MSLHSKVGFVEGLEKIFCLSVQAWVRQNSQNHRMESSQLFSRFLLKSRFLCLLLITFIECKISGGSFQ